MKIVKFVIGAKELLLNEHEFITIINIMKKRHKTLHLKLELFFRDCFEGEDLDFIERFLK